MPCYWLSPRTALQTRAMVSIRLLQQNRSKSPPWTMKKQRYCHHFPKTEYYDKTLRVSMATGATGGRVKIRSCVLRLVRVQIRDLEPCQLLPDASLPSDTADACGQVASIRHAKILRIQPCEQSFRVRVGTPPTLVVGQRYRTLGRRSARSSL